jgi:hypothetical protein
MHDFTQSDCYLVERDVKTDATGITPNDCHLNVHNLVASNGGSIIYGWLLVRENRLTNNGIYYWVFHSVWRRADSTIVDVTPNQYYEGNPKITFWVDSSRQADMESGTSYNSVIVLESSAAAERIAHATHTNLRVGNVYWADSSMQHFVALDDHSGIYRLLHAQYPANIRHLENEYDCTVIDGRPVPNGANKRVSSRIFFDYSVSAAVG